MDLEKIKAMIADIVAFLRAAIENIKYIFGDDIFGDAAEETTTL